MADLRDPSLPAATVIAALGLARHPEGGWYRETWRGPPAEAGVGRGPPAEAGAGRGPPAEAGAGRGPPAEAGAGRGPPAEAWEGRGVGTAILFLLPGGETSAWHRVDADELWLWQAGAPLALAIGQARLTLGPGEGETLQGIVPRHVWQSAASRGNWTLVSCVVCPAFTFAGFMLGAGDLTGAPPPD